MKDYWGWLGPLVIALLIGFAQVYSLIDRVETLEDLLDRDGERIVLEISDLQHRVRIIEAYCCEEALK